MRTTAFYTLVALGLALAGCGGATTTVEPTSAPTSAPTAPAATTAPAEEPTAPAATTAPAEEPTPEGRPAIGVIPAPVYFITNQDQVARVEIDGTTITPVSDEPNGVSRLEVSPQSGAVAYVMVEQGTPPLLHLISSGPLGQDRRELAVGTFTNMAFSPAGDALDVGVYYPPPDTLAGGQALAPGVWRFPLDGSAPTLLVPHTPSSSAADGSIVAGLHYAPIAWSPDGLKLLLSTAPYFGPGAPGGDIGSLGLAVFERESGVVRQLLPGQQGPLCLSASWDPQSVAVYCSSSFYVGDETPALWRLNLVTGEQTPLIPVRAGETLNQVRDASELGDGLYSIRGTSTDDGQSQSAFAIVRSAQDATSQLTELTAAPVALANGDTLWASDGSGAVLLQQVAGGPIDIVWYPFVAGGTPTTLVSGVRSSELEWGQP